MGFGSLLPSFLEGEKGGVYAESSQPEIRMEAKVDKQEYSYTSAYANMAESLSVSVAVEATYAQPMSQDVVNETVNTLGEVEAERLADLPPWQRYAKPVPLKEGYGAIAIVIDDVGVVRERSEAVVRDLPNEITLSFLPYGDSTAELSLEAFEKGHEIMIHVPMQPKAHADGYVADPGPNALITSLSLDEVRKRTEQHMESLLSLSVGVNNHMGSAFTEWYEGMNTVLDAVAAENLMFMDSVTTSKSQVMAAGKGKGIPLLRRDIFLDHSQKKEDIRAALAKVEAVAKAQGSVIAIGHPHPETIEVLAEWVNTLDEKKLQLIPISMLIKE